MNTVTAIAPGKIILTGEHAVVHGAPALVTAVSVHSMAVIRRQAGNTIDISTPFGTRRCNGDGSLDGLVAAAHDRLSAFNQGRLPIARVLPDPLDFVTLCLGLAFEEVDTPPPCNLSLLTDLPLGAGTGSSAAVAAACLLAARTAVDQSPTPDELYQLTFEAETFQHGTPSGVDPHAAVHGGAFRFQKGKRPVSLALRTNDLMFVHTGRPASTTGECVAAAREPFAAEDRLQRFSEIAMAIEDALESGDVNDLKNGIRKNHRELVDIGVVPVKIQAWIAELESRGAAAKVCGAGSIRGDAAGMVWIVGELPDDWWKQCPYERWHVSGEHAGARIIG